MRRVCKSIKKFTDAKQRSFLLLSDMMFASSDMDGKLKLVSPLALLNQTQQPANQIVNTPTTPLAEEHFVETECGIADSCAFRVGQNDYILLGFEDGSLHVYNMSAGFGKPYKRVAKKPSVQRDDYDQFLESNYEHQAPIISVDTQPSQKESPMIVSASQDGSVFLWTINATAIPDEEDML